MDKDPQVRCVWWCRSMKVLSREITGKKNVSNRCIVMNLEPSKAI